MTSFAHIIWDEEGQPISPHYDDVYFSCANGLEETRYVFIQHNHLKERWEALPSSFPNNEFIIGETGFGTGLNFLATWQLWESLRENDKHKKNIPNNKILHFVSVEKHPLLKKDLEQSLSLWPELNTYSKKLLSVYDDYPSNGFKHYYLSESVKLTLIINDATEGFNQLIASDHPWFRKATNNAHGIDAWFLDGFSPAKNPEMWSSELFNILAELSHDQTTLSTFTAAGFVRRGLESSGFSIKKSKGFAHKRELITGHFNHSPLDIRNKNRPDCTTNTFTSPYPVPWYVQNENLSTESKHKNVTIIGAGIAGCFTANSLARRGWKVTIVDSADKPASAASGNPQGIIYGKLSKDTDWLAQLNSACLPFAEQFYQKFWGDNETQIGQQCGVLQLAHNANEKNVFNQLKSFFESDISNPEYISDHVQFLSPKEASSIAGITIDDAAIFFPKLGWINPPKLCEVLLSHDNITFLGNTLIKELEIISTDDCTLWNIFNDRNEKVHVSDYVVISAASDAKQFTQSHQLPLKNIRGQISQISPLHSNANAISLNLKAVICGDGYIAPPNIDGVFTIGATFTLHNNDLAVTGQDNEKNVSCITVSIPSTKSYLEQINKNEIEGRTGYRCTTPDYLPIVGPLHNHSQFLDDYSRLKKNANASIPVAGHHFKNLYVNVGYGSRGLAYAPLCSEFLSAQMNGDIWPISRSLATALHPGRFTIRNLIRNKL